MTMKKISQYRLWPDIDQELQLPVGAIILNVKQYFGDLSLWALCEEYADDSKRAARKIRIVETGKPMSDDVQRWTYISTYTEQAFGKVFHVFEEHELDPWIKKQICLTEGQVRGSVAGEVFVRS
jgi:hypothetical protein